MISLSQYDNLGALPMLASRIELSIKFLIFGIDCAHVGDQQNILFNLEDFTPNANPLEF